MPDDRVAIAVSGGADSVAMTWLLRELVDLTAMPGSLVGLVHVNHGLRGAESDRDEAFVRALGERLGLPVDVTRLDVASEARRVRRSVEATAREGRDRAIREAMGRLGATRVATAHTADDQAETVLLRLLRGSSTRGAGGIRPRRARLIRPVLDMRRASLRADLVTRGEAWCEDSTNADVSIPRNAIRHELLPVIERLSPGAVPALARFAALCRDDEEALEAAAIEAARKIVLFKGGVVRLERGGMSGMAAAVARRLVRQVLETVGAGAVGARQIDAIRALAAADTSKGHLDVRGASVELTAETLVVGRTTGRGPAEVRRFDRPLSVPGSVDVPEAGVRVVAELATLEVGQPLPNGRGPAAAVQRSVLRGGLHVRSRLPGDRLRPLGAPGRRKVQDVLVDQKVPRQKRDQIAVVVDDAGRIVWVAGCALADECRVTAPESGVVLLKIIDL